MDGQWLKRGAMKPVSETDFTNAVFLYDALPAGHSSPA